MQVNIHEAKDHFSQLVASALGGEEVIIARSGRPILRLVPIRPERSSGVRLGGLKDAGIELDESFYNRLDDSEPLGSKA